jgi:hypothetical protein
MFQWERRGLERERERERDTNVPKTSLLKTIAFFFLSFFTVTVKNEVRPRVFSVGKPPYAKLDRNLLS